jgi:hypothetical protein
MGCSGSSQESLTTSGFLLCQGGDGTLHLRSGPACIQALEDGQRFLPPLPCRHGLPRPGEHRVAYVQEPALDVAGSRVRSANSYGILTPRAQGTHER